MGESVVNNITNKSNTVRPVELAALLVLLMADVSPVGATELYGRDSGYWMFFSPTWVAVDYRVEIINLPKG